MPHFKLSYFGFPGKGEPIRLAFAMGGVEFENHLITHEEWAALKPTVAPMQLPLMEIDGQRVSQSLALFRYACKLSKVDGHPLYPEDPFEALLVDEMTDKVMEVFAPLGRTFQIADEKEKEAARAAMVAKGGDVEKWAAHIDSVLAKSKSGFAVADRVTMADLAIFVTLSLFRCGWLDGCPTNCFDHLTALCKHRDMMAAMPQIKDYYADKEGAAYSMYK